MSIRKEPSIGKQLKESDMEMNNPYEAPDADLGIATNEIIDLSHFKKVSTWLVFLYSIVTLGVYMMYWLYTRTKTLNKLPRVKPVSNAFMFSVIIIFSMFYPLLIGEIYFDNIPEYVMFSNIASFVGNILILVWSFKFRNRLNTYIEYNTANGTKLGVVLTWFLQSIYLSYKLNENIDIHENTT